MLDAPPIIAKPLKRRASWKNPPVLVGATLAFLFFLGLIAEHFSPSPDFSPGSPGRTGFELGRVAHQQGMMHPDAAQLHAMARDKWPGISVNGQNEFESGFEYGWKNADY